MPKDKPTAKGKGGKILGMPYWAAGLALALGLVAGYFLLKKSGGTQAGSSQSNQAQKPAEDSGGGGGGIAAMPTDTLSALGITPPNGYGPSEGSTNGDTSQQTASPQATFDAAVNYSHQRFKQGGAALNQSAVQVAHQQINPTPTTINPTVLSYVHGILNP